MTKNLEIARKQRGRYYRDETYRLRMFLSPEPSCLIIEMVMNYKTFQILDVYDCGINYDGNDGVCYYRGAEIIFNEDLPVGRIGTYVDCEGLRTWTYHDINSSGNAFEIFSNWSKRE